MDDLRYPLGRMLPPVEYTPAVRDELIRTIERTPLALREALAGLIGPQLDTPYRPEGWTVRQVVHHLADSHMNAYIRTKLAVTEQEPTIKPYDEKAWANLADSAGGDPETSLHLLELLHMRWIQFLRSLAPEDFQRACKHPERGLMTVDSLLALYAWHGRHHVAHITSLRERMKW